MREVGFVVVFLGSVMLAAFTIVSFFGTIKWSADISRCAEHYNVYTCKWVAMPVYPEGDK